MDFLASALCEHPRSRVVCQEPVRLKLGGESQGLGFPLIQKPGT